MRCSRGALWTGAPARAAMSASPGRVDHALRQKSLAPRLALRDHAPDRASLQHGRNAQPVQKRRDAGLFDQDVGNVLEHLRIERVAERLRLRRRRPHGPRPLLELDADSLAVDRALMPVPGEPLDTHLSDVAAEAAMALHQGRARPGARRRERGREAARAAAHHEHLGLVDDVHRARGLRYALDHQGFPLPAVDPESEAAPHGDSGTGTCPDPALIL